MKYKKLPTTNCKLHCGVRAVRCLCSFLDRHVLSDTDALRNPQRQLTSDRCKRDHRLHFKKEIIITLKNNIKIEEI